MQLSVGMPPGPRALEYAQTAQELGYDRVWSPEPQAWTMPS